MAQQENQQPTRRVTVNYREGLLGQGLRPESFDIPYQPDHPAAFPERKLVNQRFRPDCIDAIIQGGSHVAVATITSFYCSKPILANITDLRVALVVGFVFIFVPIFYYHFATSVDPATRWGLGWRLSCTLIGIILGVVNAR
jgi:hypothetical protein